MIGQSRGGLFARVLAVRRPDLVRSIVTLGSPHSRRWRSIRWCGSRAPRSPAWARSACRGLPATAAATGRAARSSRTDLAAPMPKGVRFASIYSKRDGIVDWPACLDPHAVHLEVRSTHCGMGGQPGRLRAARLGAPCTPAAGPPRAAGGRAAPRPDSAQSGFSAATALPIPSSAPILGRVRPEPRTHVSIEPSTRAAGTGRNDAAARRRRTSPDRRPRAAVADRCCCRCSEEAGYRCEVAPRRPLGARAVRRGGLRAARRRRRPARRVRARPRRVTSWRSHRARRP